RVLVIQVKGAACRPECCFAPARRGRVVGPPDSGYCGVALQETAYGRAGRSVKARLSPSLAERSQNHARKSALKNATGKRARKPAHVSGEGSRAGHQGAHLMTAHRLKRIPGDAN